MPQEHSWVEVSKSALRNNIENFKGVLSDKAELMFVVKANAYGHGMVETAKIGLKYGADWLATVNLSEAIELRKKGINAPVLVLSYYSLEEDDIIFAIKNKISLVVYSLEQAKFIDEISKALEIEAKIHLKIDTGTSRLGVRFNRAFEFISEINDFDNLEIEGIYSHFAASEENQKFTEIQLDRFKELLKDLDLLGFKIRYRHFACSAAIMTQLESHFNLVRLGVSAYGLWPSEQAQKIAKRNFGEEFNLRPVMSVYTKIVQLKQLEKGDCDGYGCTYRVRQKTKIAVIAMGYFEGLDRHLSNKGEVLIHGRRCKILGRICMNLTMVDVSQIENITVGDKVTLIGIDGAYKITAEDLARDIGTINYEVVSRINPLLPRYYVE